MDFPALGCYRQYSAPHCPIFSYANFHRRAMEKKRDNLGSTWRPVQRLGGQLLTQFLTRSRRGWWVRSSGSIDLGYKLRSPQSIRPFRCLWTDLTGSAFQTTSESFTFTDDSNGDTFYVCKANLDFAIRVTTGQSIKVKVLKLEREWKIKNELLLRSSLAERNNIMLFLFLDQKAAQPHSCRSQEHGWFWYLKTVSSLKVFQLFRVLI